MMLDQIRHTDIVKKSRAAVEWLQSHAGIKGTSRYCRYLKVWEEIVNSADLPNGGTSDIQVERIQNKYGLLTFRGAVHEIADLVHVHEAFLNQEVPPALLRKVNQGRDCEIEEVGEKPKTSSPRNFLFQLTTATTFKTNGFSVKLDSEADVVSDYENHRIFIECKRLFSERSLERNITKAADQLDKRFNKFGFPVNCVGQIPVGMIALSVTKLINPNQDYLKAPSMLEAARLMNQEIDRLWLRRRSLILEKCSPNVIATGFFVRIPIMVPGGFGSFRRWKFFAHPSYEDNFSNIAKRILLQLKSTENI